jgi:peptide-methionine (S)-S-oxide reductase
LGCNRLAIYDEYQFNLFKKVKDMIKNLGPVILLATAIGFANAGSKAESAVFAGGCFWSIDGIFKHVKGISDVISEYAGGKLVKPTYPEVSFGRRGYAESVLLTYDPRVVSYKTLLEIFFRVASNPTEFNRQGPDISVQYRSAIFYQNESERKVPIEEIASLTKGHIFSTPIVTQVSALDHFCPAESHHQKSLASYISRPHIVLKNLPKLGALKERFPRLYF